MFEKRANVVKTDINKCGHTRRFEEFLSDVPSIPLGGTDPVPPLEPTTCTALLLVGLLLGVFNNPTYEAINQVC